MIKKCFVFIFLMIHTTSAIAQVMVPIPRTPTGKLDSLLQKTVDDKEEIRILKDTITALRLQKAPKQQSSKASTTTGVGSIQISFPILDKLYRENAALQVDTTKKGNLLKELTNKYIDNINYIVTRTPKINNHNFINLSERLKDKTSNGFGYILQISISNETFTDYYNYVTDSLKTKYPNAEIIARLDQIWEIFNNSSNNIMIDGIDIYDLDNDGGRKSLSFPSKNPSVNSSTLRFRVKKRLSRSAGSYISPVIGFYLKSDNGEEYLTSIGDILISKQKIQIMK